jgi:hypothetical protein
MVYELGEAHINFVYGYILNNHVLLRVKQAANHKSALPY